MFKLYSYLIRTVAGLDAVEARASRWIVLNTKREPSRRGGHARLFISASDENDRSAPASFSTREMARSLNLGTPVPLPPGLRHVEVGK